MKYWDYGWGGDGYPKYDGFLDRGTSKAVAQQGMQQSQEDQNNASAALTATNADLGTYSTNLKNYMNFGRKTYGANGEFMRDQNTLATTTAAAGASALKGNLALNAMRTGENTSGYGGTVAATQQENDQNLTTQLAGADAQRLSQLNAVEQYGVSASALPAEIEQGIYGTSTSGASSNLSPAATAAAQPSGWDVFGADLASGVGAAAGAYAAGCPCAGTAIAVPHDVGMPGDTDRVVEVLKKGDFVAGMGWTRPPNQLLADIVPIKQPCFEVITKGGLRTRGSSTHSLMLVSGGYVCMPEALGEAVLVRGSGSDMITEVIDIGEQWVYPLPIKGSHTYCADGLWILA